MSNLIRENNIVIEVSGGCANARYLPGKTEWNGRLIILDYDTDGAKDESLVTVTDDVDTFGQKPTQSKCVITEYGEDR
jgi:hypothetical protein